MPKAIGTPVRCPACRHPNLAIDIWCERCGTPLDWSKTGASARRDQPVQSRTAHAPPQTSVDLARRPLVERGRSDQRVYCWSCGVANAADEGFCNGCGAALGSLGTRAAPSGNGAQTRRGLRMPKLVMPWLAGFALPNWRAPRLRLPQLRIPKFASSRIGRGQAPPLTWIVGIVVLLLLIAPLSYILFPSHGGAATSAIRAAEHPANLLKSGSPEAVAASAVEAKTGLKYSASCAGSRPCLTITGETMGQHAAAVAFSTAHAGGQQCVGYVVQNTRGWVVVNTSCGRPGRVTPMLGENVAVHVPGNCANVRNSPSLQGGVVVCLYDGTKVHLDGGPIYADAVIWWHTTRGWIAHTFIASA